jgi:PRTRC genetic system protein F
MGIKSKKERKPNKPLDTARVSKWLNSQEPSTTMTQCVQAAIALRKALDAKGSPDFSFHTGADEVEPVGAMCFLAWDDPSILWDAAGHSEEMAYNSGEVLEAFARRTYPLGNGISDQQLADLVKDTKGFLKQWHLLEQLVSHFPTAGDDDEI